MSCWPPPSAANSPTPTPACSTAAEREIFTRAIELAQGNQAKAARWLGISRLTLREKLHQFGLHPAQDHTET